MFIDGKQIRENVKEEIKNLLTGRDPQSVGIFYVGTNPVIENFIRIKEKNALELGISTEVLRYDESISEEDLVKEVQKHSERFSGVIIQLPLPEKFDRETILGAIPLEKDIDVLSAGAVRAFSDGSSERLPPTVFAINEIFQFYNIPLFPKKIVVVGKGMLVGRPLAMYFECNKIPFEIVDEHTEGKDAIIREADIIISGVGIPGIITEDMVKDGVVLIDAGTSSHAGTISGDVSKEASQKASLVSPVPGGVGPLTVLGLFKNLFLK
jgi:methylenetetrahydrofolate dehydrogenase (NADP+)/methenyltetrahydrofolate cyclohydrolase